MGCRGSVFSRQSSAGWLPVTRYQLLRCGEQHKRARSQAPKPNPPGLTGHGPRAPRRRPPTEDGRPPPPRQLAALRADRLFSGAETPSLAGPKSPDLNDTVARTELPVSLLRRGKVRDVYDLGDALLMVATDRVSAFDVVLPQPVPRKGERSEEHTSELQSRE